jgi:hypothetical protein
MLTAIGATEAVHLGAPDTTACPALNRRSLIERGS